MRSMLTTVMIAGAIALGSAPARAQGTPQPDPRWSAWLGCWTPVDAVTALTGMPSSRTVCVVPAAGASAVDIATIVNGKVASREHIEATGDQRQTTRDGCSGWERARWSADARRVYLDSEFTCADGAKRTSSGLVAMSTKGEWLNVAGVTMGGRTGVRVLRHQAVDFTSRVPPEVASALQGTMGGTAASRIAVASPIGNAEIIEASHELDAPVVEAWLSEAGQAFTANVKRLVTLADAGVPDRVIDMIVALSYPNAFAIKPSATDEGVLAVGGIGSGGGIDFGEFSGAGGVGACAPYSTVAPPGYQGFSLYGWDNCAMYYGYSPYAYSRYRSVPYGTWYLNSQPIVIIQSPNGGAAGPHGQVTRGGYVAGGSGSTATSSGTSSGSDSGSSGNAGGTPGTTGSGSDSGDRTAKPR